MIGAIAGGIVGSVIEQTNIKQNALLHGRDMAENFRKFYRWYPRAGYGTLFNHWASSPDGFA